MTVWSGSSLFGPLRSSGFRRLGSWAVDIFRGSALLFGISSLALPAWNQRMRRPDLVRVLIAPGAIDTRTQANPPHPSSREGHLSASRQNSNSETPPYVGGQFDFRQATVGVILFVQRNTDPSTHMRCMITANRRASATMAFFRPRRLATFIAQAFNDDHFFTRVI